MFDGEEIRTESEQQEVRSGESGAERDEISRVEVSSGPVEHGGEVIELEVINRCSQDAAANEGGEENVVQPSTTSAALSTPLPPPVSSSLLLNSSSVATASRPHQVQALITLIFTCSLYNSS